MEYYRTLLEIVSCDAETGVTVIMDGWDWRIPVSFPLTWIDDADIQQSVITCEKPAYIMAEATIGVATKEKMRIRAFEHLSVVPEVSTLDDLINDLWKQ